MDLERSSLPFGRERWYVGNLPSGKPRMLGEMGARLEHLTPSACKKLSLNTLFRLLSNTEDVEDLAAGPALR